jgi:hypothetical protein
VNIKPGLLSDPIAEETLAGLLLTGSSDVYRFADAEPSDFENQPYRAIWEALECIHAQSVQVPVATIYGWLDEAGLVEPGDFALPLSWFVDTMSRAVVRTNEAMDKTGMTLPEAVTALSLRVKLAAANRYDRMSGNTVRNEIESMRDDTTTLHDVYLRVMEADGDAAEYLSRFREDCRLSVLRQLIGTEERVGV